MLKNHPYIPNASMVMGDMLKTAGVEKVEDFFDDVPKFPFEITEVPTEALDEISVKRRVEGILGKNIVCPERCFTGGGPWFHHVPSVIKHIISRGEFLTSYTPYQFEVSQGVLQSLFEFQSMICELYDLDVANASMYDLSTAIGEAALLCSRVTGRKRFLVPKAIPHERRSVIDNYTISQGISIQEVPFSEKDGGFKEENFKEQMGNDVAGVYVENPNYFGVVNDVRWVADIAHDHGALCVIGSDPLSLGVLKPPGAAGADVAVGDGQPLGIPPGLGGNTLGIMACRDDPRIIRQMPGRIVGMTKTLDGGRRGFVLALSTREQHIRREKATSNICTNETLFAIAATIYLSLLGGRGIAGVAKRIFGNTQYAIERLTKIDGVHAVFDGYYFRDFALTMDNAPEVDRYLSEVGIFGGRDLSNGFGGLQGGRLFSVSEIHTREDIDGLVAAVAAASGGA